MKRWIVPAATVLVVAVAVVGATVVPAPHVPPVTASVDVAQVSIVCPVQDASGVTRSFAAVSASQPVRLTPFGGKEEDQKNLLTVVAKPTAWTRVSAAADGDFGGTAWLSAADTAEQGLSGAPCLVPSTEQWFTGVRLSTDAQASIVLANIDSTDAMVDATIWTADGLAQAAGLGSIKVPAGQTTQVPLDVKTTAAAPVAVRIAASKGRVVAYLRQQLWQDAKPRGADWVPAGARPATALVLPGIPAGAGARSLVLANPGGDPVLVEAEMLGENGRSAVQDASAIEVPGQSVVTLDVADALAEQAGALRLTATGDIAAGLLLSSGDSASTSDPAYLAAASPLAAGGLWPLPVGRDTSLVLQLTNTTGAERTAHVTTAKAPRDNEKAADVALPADTTVLVKLPADQDVVVLGVQASGDGVYGAVVGTAKLDDIAGLAVVPLVSADPPQQKGAVAYDPHIAT